MKHPVLDHLKGSGTLLKEHCFIALVPKSEFIFYLILSTALKSGYSSSTEQKGTMEKDCLMSNINKPEGKYFFETYESF